MISYCRLLLLPLIVLGLASCSSDVSFIRLDGGVWNTTYSIRYRGDASLADSVQLIMRQIEMSLSPFNKESVISRVNNNESTEVDDNVARVFEISKKVNSISGGAFDPTLSPLINLWGFGYTGDCTAEPSDSLIASTLAVVGLSDCRIDGRVLTKKSARTTFNFSAVTKGYGCDEIARMLKRNGVDDYMIEIGGEIALGGLNDRHRSWRVMVDAPVDTVAGHEGLLTVELTDCGIATSGNYRNFKDTGAGRVGHTISPVTGRPIRTDLLSATVIAPDCATADALATACMAMPVDSAQSMINNLPDVRAILVKRAPDGTFEVVDICGDSQ